MKTQIVKYFFKKKYFLLKMSCLSRDDFKLKYPKGAYLSKGAYGKIYISGDNVIKKQGWDSDSFTKELCILSEFKHPNICPVLDISFHKDNGYMALPQGSSVSKAYLDGLITIREIVTDIFSGMNFLNSNGIAHKDLKIDNCIYHEGRVKIIDLGLASFCDLYETGYTFNDVAYTEPFKDPEYDEYENNPITVELYSIATTIYYMLTNKYFSGMDRNYYISRQNFEDLNIDSDLIDLLLECQKPLAVRKSIEELILHPSLIKNRITITGNVLPLEKYSGNIPLSSLPSKSGVTSGVIKTLFEWMYQISVNFYGINSYFLACDMVYRFLQNNAIDMSKFQLLGSCSLYIAALLNSEEVSIRDIIYSTGRLYSSENFMEMYCTMYTILQGKFYNKTLWDTIQFDYEIYNFAAFMSRPEFMSNQLYMLPYVSENNKINRYEHKTLLNSHTKFDKDVVVELLDRDYEEFPVEDKSSVNINTIISKLNNVCIKKVNASEYEYYTNIISLTASNIDKLQFMNNKNAFDLYEKLLENAINSNSFEFIRRTVNFNDMLTLQEIQTYRKALRRVNIFTLIDQDIDRIINIQVSPPVILIPEPEYINNTSELIVKLSQLMAVTGSGETLTYKINDISRNINDRRFISNVIIQTANRTEAVIDMFNILRNINSDIWMEQLDIVNSIGDLSEWINTCFDPRGLSSYYLTRV